MYPGTGARYHDGAWRSPVDCRNCLTPSSAPGVPLPAGERLHGGVEMAGRPGSAAQYRPGAHRGGRRRRGGNLTLATGLSANAMAMGLIRGLYACVPVYRRRLARDRCPLPRRTTACCWTAHSNRGAMAYGAGQFERGNPLAWPSFAAVEELRGLVPANHQRQRCDPLRDEGIEFYHQSCCGGGPARAAGR